MRCPSCAVLVNRRLLRSRKPFEDDARGPDRDTIRSALAALPIGRGTDPASAARARWPESSGVAVTCDGTSDSTPIQIG